ncbi:MAG: hypothetical protein ACP5LP_03810 [Candidatus Micrarchaeia archaeon]
MHDKEEFIIKVEVLGKGAAIFKIVKRDDDEIKSWWILADSKASLEANLPKGLSIDEVKSQVEKFVNANIEKFTQSKLETIKKIFR